MFFSEWLLKAQSLLVRNGDGEGRSRLGTSECALWVALWGPTLTARRSVLRFLSSNLPFRLHGMTRLQLQLTSWESGALTGRCLQNAKHLGGQGGGSYSLFIASKETGEISIKIQVLKFDCFPRRDSYIFCFVILFRVRLVDSILRRGLSCVSPPPPPPTSFPTQVSKIPHHPLAPTFRSLNLIWICCGLWAAADTGWLGDPCGFVSIWREWVGAFYNSSRTRQLKSQSQKEQRVPQLQSTV